MKLSQNTVINLFGAVLPLILTLGTVPTYLHFIGDVRFGVLAIVWLLLSYFGLFDMGLGRATSKHMASLYDSSGEDRESLFWSALSINFGFGLIGAALLYGFGSIFLQKVFSIPADMRPEVFGALPWVASAVPVATCVSVLVGTLEGREQFLRLNSLQLFGTVLFQLGPLIVAWQFGPNLKLLISSAVLARLVATIPMCFACRKHIPLTGRVGIRRHWFKDLFSFGGWVTVSGVLNPILTSLDRMLVGAIQGAQALTYYTVSFNFAMKLTILGSSATRTLFPRFSMLEEDEATQLATRATLGLTVLLTPIVIVILVCLYPFFVLWLGPRVASYSARTGEIFLVGYWVNSLALVPHSLLQARSRPDIVAKFHAIEVIPFVGVLWIGLHYGGIEGAAWVWTLRSAVDALLLFAAAGITSKIWQLIAPAALCILTTQFAIAQAANRTALSAIIGILSLAGYGAWTWLTARTTVNGVWNQGVGFLTSVRAFGTAGRF